MGTRLIWIIDVTTVGGLHPLFSAHQLFMQLATRPAVAKSENGWSTLTMMFELFNVQSIAHKSQARGRNLLIYSVFHLGKQRSELFLIFKPGCSAALRYTLLSKVQLLL